MDKMDERKLNSRKAHQEQDFCKSIFQKVRELDQIYIFGPAQMKDILAKFIHAQKGMKPTLMGVDTAGYLTDNQKKAHVQAVFTNIMSD